ncbi:SMI1/KNR4 family protein [Ruegeria sp. HKCCD8929]|uniref:SMI1/KNR4 family protein n=1 Tax=Ruegeria sp. HKCCD8929 TaxID=2683006 RepID=UPI001488BD20|nr:SMI1/KNR4 family protein [Ruegeria sp. HKCCD8929]
MQIDKKTLAAWNADGITPATREEISQLRTRAGDALPDDYLNFVATYGFPSWPLDAASRFTHLHDLGHRQVTQEDDLGSLIQSGQMKYTEHELTEALPGLSPRLARAMPLAGTYDGHSLLVLELAPVAGRVWHWSDESLWIDFDTPTLSFVANSFSAFIEGLAPLTDHP